MSVRLRLLLRPALAVCLLLAGSGMRLAAQGTAPVPLDDPAYAYLDRLEELGVVDSAVMGQRPYSFREMGRLAGSVRAAAGTRQLGSRERRLVHALLARLERRVMASPHLHSLLIDEALLVVSGTNAVRRAIPPAGSGSPPEASIDPLALRRLGEPAPRGRSQWLEVLQRGEPTSWLGFRARARVEARQPRDTIVAGRHAELLVGSLRARWRNAALTVGREQLGWGPGNDGGLFIAADAPALDQVTLATERPFLLPGWLRRAGPVSATLVVANMGPSLVRSHSKLLAYKLSARPAPAIELGATFQNHYGGEGGRPSPIFHRLIDFLPIIDIFRRHNYSDSTRLLDVDSDKVIGVDARWRIDRLGGTIVSGEWLLDDFDVQRLTNTLNSAGSHALVVTVPRLGLPEWSLKLRATHMGPLTYTNYWLKQGMTTRGRLIGNELGPDVKSFDAELRWMPTSAVRVALTGRTSIYSNASYSSSYDADGRWVVRKSTSAPDELREQAIGTLTLEPTASAGLTLRAGMGRTRNVMFTGGRRHSYVADALMRWRP